MQKPVIATLLVLMTTLSGITYYTLQHQTQYLRNEHDVSTSEIYEQWLGWMKQYSRNYPFKEMPLKFSNFKENYIFIQTHNKKKSSFKCALNQFSDLSNSEFAALTKGLLTQSTRKDVQLNNVEIPVSIDWRAKGAVTPVKNQGQCGSCWAFSTTGSLEGEHFLETGTLTSFSEQQLVDCSGSYGNQGCNGGLMDNAFKYVEVYGIETEAEYPYTAMDGTCTYKKSLATFKNTGYSNVPKDNNGQLKAAVAQHPTSVAIQANAAAFQSYHSGIFDDAGCGTQLDHGVLVVGYGSTNGVNYWIVKNSWAASWGDNGYIKIQDVSGAGICGINMMASYPTPK